jgi:uncharacterized membrane protein YGL010W
MGQMGQRSWDDWIGQYAASHRHPVNRACHTVGIPMIAVSIPLFAAALWGRRALPVAAGLFGAGWILQFIGHAFEGKPPEFFRDWRFLFVGLRWWFAKIRGKA